MDTKDAKSGESSGFVTIDGAKIHYVMEGKGTPCIMIGSSVYHRRTFSQELRKHLKLVFMDARLFAPSSSQVPVEEVKMDTMVDDVEHVRQTIGFEKVAVMGHSAFALVAFEYARKYPEHASHAIMIGMTPGWNEEIWGPQRENWEANASDERKRILRNNFEKLTEDVLSKASPSERVAKRYVANGPKYWYDPFYDCSWIWEGVVINHEVWDHFFNKVLNEYVIHPEEVSTPVFLALGKYDYICPYFLWDNLKDSFVDLSYNLFEKSGHTPQLEEQALFYKKLINWIKSTSNISQTTISRARAAHRKLAQQEQ